MIDEFELNIDIYKFNESKEYIDDFNSGILEITYEQMIDDIKMLYSLWNTAGGVYLTQKTESDFETMDPKRIITYLQIYQKTQLNYTKEEQ